MNERRGHTHLSQALNGNIRMSGMASRFIALALAGNPLARGQVLKAIKQAEQAIIAGVLGRPVYQREEQRDYDSLTQMPDAPNLCRTLLGTTAFSMLCGQQDILISPDDVLSLLEIAFSDDYQFEASWPFTKAQMGAPLSGAKG